MSAAEIGAIWCALAVIGAVANYVLHVGGENGRRK